MPSFLSRAAGSALALATLALGACGDNPTPTEDLRDLRPNPSLLIGGSTTPTITALTPSSDSVFLGGPAVPYTVTIQNPGASRSDVILQGTVVQGAANRAAGGAAVNCGQGSSVLPSGSCTMSLTLVVSNGAAGTGTLVPGGAIFELELRDSVASVIDMKGVAITLLPNTPIITGVKVASSTVYIGGSGVPYTATLDNPGVHDLEGVRIQGWIIQGRSLRAAGGAVVNCGKGVGVLPTGSCTVSSTFVASNKTAGTGTLVPGAAIFALQLSDATGAVMDTEEIVVMLASKTLQLDPLSPSSSTAPSMAAPR